MKISVIIPVYNSEKYLNRCLDSLKKQDNFNELEIIIVNDGSIDDSKDIISNFKQNNENVIVKNIKHSGVSKARNIGIDLASSKYITFLDADDYIDHDYYISMLNEIAGKNDELIVSGYKVEYENSNTKIKRITKQKKILIKDQIIDDFLFSSNIGPNVWNKLFLTEVAQKIKFDESIAIAEDKWFVFQYLTKIKTVTILPITKYNYVINNKSVSMQSFNKKKLDSLIISDRIKKIIREQYPKLTDKVNSYDIDVKCRVFCELSFSKEKEIYKDEYYKLRNDIKNYSILIKMKNSNFKHSIAFILIKISPKLYLFFQRHLKLQYKT